LALVPGIARPAARSRSSRSISSTVLHYLGGEIAEASSMASKLSPVGAEVDDQSMTLIRFADGKIGYVGSCWDLARHLCRARLRLQGP